MHISVLKTEALEYLKCQDGGVFLDCTFGAGGHSREILQANERNQLVAIDRDEIAEKNAQVLTEEFGDRFQFFREDFSGIALNQEIMQHKYTGILADLGISSEQLSAERGFSFNDQGELDMRMDPTGELTAADIVNQYSLEQLSKMFQAGGVTKGYRILSENIIKNRPINTTAELAELVIKTMQPINRKKKNPATIPFQAIRMEVNQELQQIKDLLFIAPQITAANARMVMISFHSLEDQLVTKQMRRWSAVENPPALWQGKDGYQESDRKPLGKLLTKKAVFASDQEVVGNPRARSAMLRVFEFN